MTNEELKFITRKMFDEAYNTGNLDLLDQYYASNLICHRPPYPDIEDLHSYKEWQGNFRQAFPDVKIEIVEILGDGNTVAARMTYSGTHTGILGTDIQPTGKHVSGLGCMIWHWKGDKVVEEWEYWDELGFWQQLGYRIVPSQ